MNLFQDISPPQSRGDGGGWNKDNWETPDHIAELMAREAVRRFPDGYFLEPAAGRGRVAKFLPTGAFALEIDPARRAIGEVTAPHCIWQSGDFLRYLSGPFHAIITNPPFSQWEPFIAHAATLLRDGGCVIALLPTQRLQNLASRDLLKRSGIRIEEEIKIINRVRFLRDGVPQNADTFNHSVFVFGRGDWRESFTGRFFEQ